MDKNKFTKVILINIGIAFIYGIIICPVISVIFYAVSGTGPGSTESGFTGGLYPVLRFGLVAGAILGFIFAVILGMLYRPYKSVVYIKDENIFLSSLNAAIGRINYELEKKDKNLYIFEEKKNTLAKILVRIKDSNAVIYGHFNKVAFINKTYQENFRIDI